jgi:hypothetical protein
MDSETNVSPDYKQANNAFTGKIVRVTVEQRKRRRGSSRRRDKLRAVAVSI